MTDVPSLVDMERLGAEIGTLPAEVTKLAPAKYRVPTTLGQTLNDLKKQINDLQRTHDEYTRQFKQSLDELLRIIG